MTNEDITKTARHLRRIHETADPRALCHCLDIQVDSFPMGVGKSALKGLIVRNSRCATISVNSDQPERTQAIVLFHEIGHYVLKHHVDLCQYFGHKKLKVHADFFNSSSSFCWGVI